jgi:hypothetical protein
VCGGLPDNATIELISPSRALILSYLALQNQRRGELLKSLARYLHSRSHAPRDGRRLAVERADPAPQGVDQRPLHLAYRLRGKVLVSQPARVVAQVFGREVHETLLPQVIVKVSRLAALFSLAITGIKLKECQFNLGIAAWFSAIT